MTNLAKWPDRHGEKTDRRQEKTRSKRVDAFFSEGSEFEFYHLVDSMKMIPGKCLFFWIIPHYLIIATG
jgi:hypothetical protein